MQKFLRRLEALERRYLLDAEGASRKRSVLASRIHRNALGRLAESDLVILETIFESKKEPLVDVQKSVWERYQDALDGAARDSGFKSFKAAKRKLGA